MGRLGVYPYHPARGNYSLLRPVRDSAYILVTDLMSHGSSPMASSYLTPLPFPDTTLFLQDPVEGEEEGGGRRSSKVKEDRLADSERYSEHVREKEDRQGLGKA